METGKKRLNGDTTREATSDEVADLHKENQQLKEMLAELIASKLHCKKKLGKLGNRKISMSYKDYQ